MDEPVVTLPSSAVRKLLGAGSGDAALLYLYLQAGFDPLQAQSALQLTQNSLDCAYASLRQMGLIAEKKRILEPAERPNYTEADIAREMKNGREFELLVGEVQRRLGRTLSGEELKILLSLHDYLRLPNDVIAILLTYCTERARARGNVRPPSMRTIEKEAYVWADNGIDTFEEAAAFMRRFLQCQSRIGDIRRLLQIRDRRLTSAEERYVTSWLDMGFGEAEIEEAYNRTCLNTGGLKWQYMNSILQSWQSRGLLTLEKIRLGDTPSEPTKKQKYQPLETELDPMLLKSIRQRLNRNGDDA